MLLNADSALYHDYERKREWEGGAWESEGDYECMLPVTT